MSFRAKLAESILRVPHIDYAPAFARSLLLALGSPIHFPDTIQVETSRRCNLKCVMCFRTYWDQCNKPDFELNAFKRLTDESSFVKCLVLSGLGEPFLNSHLMDMIEFAHARGIYIRFSTNFSVIGKEDIERIATMKNVATNVSIESGDPEVFADIRRGTTLETVLGNLQCYLDARKRAGGGGAISVNIILMKCSLTGLGEHIARLKKMGVDGVTVTDLNTSAFNPEMKLRDGSTMGEQPLNAFMRESEIEELIASIRQYQDDSFFVIPPGEMVGFKNVSRKGKGVLTCRELWTWPYVTCDGTVMPCCWSNDPATFNMGNINNNKFADIWFNDRYRKLRFQHLTNTHPTHCLNCQQLMCVVADPSKLFSPSPISQRFDDVFLNLRGRRL